MQSEKAIRLVIDSNLEAVFLVGLAVRGICSHSPLDPLAVYQVELSVVEAVNNVVKHAYDNERGHEIEILVSLHMDRLIFQIRDRGFSLDSEAVPRMEFDPNDLNTLPEGGMGLHIIRSVMDTVEFRRCEGVNVLTLSKVFQKSSDCTC